MAGGSGSGKGFVLKNLVGVTGKIFDVDKLKDFALKSSVLQKKLDDSNYSNVNLFNLDLNNPKDNDILHKVLQDIKLDSKMFNNMFSEVISYSNNKPNLIFDVTLGNLNRLFDISEMAQTFGYKKENIHIVWVVNDIKTAIEQNKTRGRQVPEDRLKEIHSKVKHSLIGIFKNELDIKKYMNGDFWVVFNKKGSDTDIEHSDLGGSYISKANVFKIKEQGKNFDSDNEILYNITNKINDYIKL
jgi:hypothetical protein